MTSLPPITIEEIENAITECELVGLVAPSSPGDVLARLRDALVSGEYALISKAEIQRLERDNAELRDSNTRISDHWHTIAAEAPKGGPFETVTERVRRVRLRNEELEAKLAPLPTPPADRTRTWKDYAEHDDECYRHICAGCGFRYEVCEKYGQEDRACDGLRRQPCTCGLDDLLKATPPGESKKEIARLKAEVTELYCAIVANSTKDLLKHLRDVLISGEYALISKADREQVALQLKGSPMTPERETPMTTRTLRDYRPRHLDDCATRRCSECDRPHSAWTDHFAVFEHPCSCGLDDLLKAAPSAEEEQKNGDQ